MAQLEILHPVAEILPASVPAARRPGTPRWRNRRSVLEQLKAGGDVALRAAAEELARAAQRITFAITWARSAAPTARPRRKTWSE